MYKVKIFNKISRDWVEMISAETIEVAKLFKASYRRMNKDLIIIIIREAGL